jgi:carbon storage regulator
MLVLTRRLGEEVVIGGNIRVTILAVQAERVQIGIAAPPPITVDRQEVHNRKAGRAGTKRSGNLDVGWHEFET